MLPLTQATWLTVQAESSVRSLKTALYCRAWARLLARTCGETVALATGTVVMTVGTATLTEPVAVTG